MLIVDSNIIIYASKPEYETLRIYLEKHKDELAASAISMVETLSFKLPRSQKTYIEAFFQNVKILPVSDEIIERAKDLQERKKLKAADAIIAVTALKYEAELITNNCSDFLKVKSLIVINPLSDKKIQN